MLNSAPQHYNIGNYQPRNPQASGYYRCVQDHFEQLEMLWQDRYAARYGFWRVFVTDVIYRYLECGDLHFGFARVRCQDCGHEYLLLAFSCKRRHFCPSCHQKRVVEFGEWLCTDVLKSVPHRQWVFSLPKRVRIYFMFDRKLLAKLSRCTWKVLGTYLKQAVPFGDAVPGAAIAVHTFGDFQQFNPHLHLIETFEALDWLAQLVTHIPNKGEQMVRYYGYYSNKSRGMRKKAGMDDQVQALVDSAVSSAAFRRNWARLIQKIYEIDPLLCPKCLGPMKIISFIEDDVLIRKILVHLRLWDTRNHDPPQLDEMHIPTIETELTYDYTTSQLPPVDYWTQ